MPQAALKYKLPSMFEQDVGARVGGLMSYGPDFEDIFRRAGRYAGRVLKGGNPAEMAMEEPRQFRFGAQPEDRTRTRTRDSAGGAAARRRGDRVKLPRWRLFPKYATLIVAVVAGVLVISGAINLVFSWREMQAHLVALQVEKAQGAATRIEQYVLDIEHQLGWTAFPLTDTVTDATEQRRFEYLKLLSRLRRSPRWCGSAPMAASGCACRAWRWM